MIAAIWTRGSKEDDVDGELGFSESSVSLETHCLVYTNCTFDAGELNSFRFQCFPTLYTKSNHVERVVKLI